VANNSLRGVSVLIIANTLYGPMHTKSGVEEYVDVVKEIKKHGGQIAFGGKVGKGFFIFFLYIVLKFDVCW